MAAGAAAIAEDPAVIYIIHAVVVGIFAAYAICCHCVSCYIINLLFVAAAAVVVDTAFIYIIHAQLLLLLLLLYLPVR